MPRRRRRRAVCLAALALAGCGETDPDELRRAAESLVPAEGRIVAREEGSCLQLVAEPSCIEVEYLIRARSHAERTELVRTAARSGDWEATGEERGSRVAFLYFERDGYEATVTILKDDWRALCTNMTECGDSVRVVRS